MKVQHWIWDSRTAGKTSFHPKKETKKSDVAMCIWTKKMHNILVIRLYFPLDALHDSDYISPSSGATL